MVSYGVVSMNVDSLVGPFDDEINFLKLIIRYKVSMKILNFMINESKLLKLLETSIC